MISTMKKLALVSTVFSAALTLPVLPAAAETPSPSGPALWKVADKDTTIYLFGTIHILPKENNWLTDKVKQAFDESNELVTEVDIDGAGDQQPKMMAAARLPDGQTLRSLMSEDERTKYEAALAQLKLPPQALDQFKPWFATNALGTIIPIRNGYAGDNGADVALNRLAGDKQKDALETIDFQLGMFDGLTQEQQLAMLDRTAKWVPLSGDTLDMMVSSWLAGDVGAVAVFLNWGMIDPEVRERLITSRNANWAEWIEHRLDRPGIVFVAVGAGHVAGRGSVQEQLAERGIETERIQ